VSGSSGPEGGSRPGPGRPPRLAVESWAPEYGSPVEAEALEPSDAQVDVAVEAPADGWAPLPSATGPAGTVRFVDGVRRIDARVWITGDDGVARPGIAASYAAGVARCDGAATVEAVEVRRGVFSASPALTAIPTRHGAYAPYAVAGDSVEELSLGVQQRMGALEALVAGAAPAADLLVVDGPLNKVPSLAGAVGYVKTHRRSYLPPELAPVVGALQAGERTPLFLMTTTWSRFSWYARLPLDGVPAHPWAGVVRGEASGDMAPAEARRLADLATATLPAFASTARRDPRAPQNLYPIGELERRLRHRLGDPLLCYRALQTAASDAGSER
jgi:uncharacterized protein